MSDASTPASSRAAPVTLPIRASTSRPSCLPKGVWAQPTMQPVMTWCSAKIRSYQTWDASDRRQAFAETNGLAQWRAQKLVVPHDDMAADDGRLGPAGHLAALEGRPGGTRRHPAALDPVLRLEVDQGQVCVIAGGDAPLAGNVVDPGRTGAGEIDQPCQGKAPRRVMVEQQRQQSLHARHARGTGGIGFGLLFQSMRRVIGADAVDDPLADRVPEPR